MHTLHGALSLLLLAVAPTGPAPATATGDEADPWAGTTAIVVAQGEVSLMDGRRVVGTINNIWVRVVQSQGEWIWVETSDGTKGWILQSQVLPADRAERVLTERIAAEPRNAELYHLRGVVRGKDGRLDAEIADINMALRLRPDEHEYYNTRGQALVEKGEVAKGLADFERGLRLKPTDEFLIYGAADAHHRLEQRAESLRHLDELVRLFPDRAYAYRSRALVRSELDRPVDALVDYGKARRLDPQGTTGLYTGLAEKSIWWEDVAEEDLAFSPPETIARFVPVDAIDWEIRAAAWAEHGMHDRAIADYTMAIRKTAAPRAYLLADRGWSSYEAGDLPAARADFDAALRLEPDLNRHLVHRGLVRLRQGDEAGALEDWQAAAAKAAAWEVDLPLDLGWLRYRRGDRPGATRDYLTARARWMANGLTLPEPLFASDDGMVAQLARERAATPRADAYAATFAAEMRIRGAELPAPPGGDLSEANMRDRREEAVRQALAELDVAAAADEGFALPCFCRGCIREQAREWSRAVEDFAEAVRRDPALGAAWFRLGYCRMEGLGDFDAALGDFQRSIDLGFDVPGAHLNRGWIRQQRGEHREAIADFDRALAVDPGYALALNDRGVSRELLGDRDGALADYTAALAVAPKDVRTLTNLGLLRQARGEFRRALDDLEAAVAADPAAHDAHAALARLRATCREEAIRDGKEGVMHATQACELSGWKNAEDLRTLACALAESGDFGAARTRLEEAFGLATDVQRAEWQPLRERFAKGEPWHDGGT